MRRRRLSPVQLFQQSTEAQIGRAEAVVARACDLIRDRYGFYAAGWTGRGWRSRMRGCAPISPRPWVWPWRTRTASREAFGRPMPGRWPTPSRPTKGPDRRRTFPPAERDQIQAVNQQAARDEQPVERRTSLGITDPAAACVPVERADQRPDSLDHDPGAGGPGIPAVAARARRAPRR